MRSTLIPRAAGALGLADEQQPPEGGDGLPDSDLVDGTRLADSGEAITAAVDEALAG